MIYLASPYSHPDKAVMEQRYHDVCKMAARLINLGYNVFSPIAHSHPLVEHGAPTDWDSWKRVDLDMLKRCDVFVILMLDGWAESVGVIAESAFALGRMPQTVIDTDDTDAVLRATIDYVLEATNAD